MHFAKRHPALFVCGLLTLLFALFTWPGCDGYLVSICQFQEREGCKSTDGGGSLAQDLAPPVQDQSQPPPANGPERAFEARVSYPIDLTHKFVGMHQGSKPLFLLSGPVRWEPLSLDLNAYDLSQRWKTSSKDGCPGIPANLDYNKDAIYTAGRAFYFLRYSNDLKAFRLTAGAPVEIRDVQLVSSGSFPTFVHPALNVIGFSSLPVGSMAYGWTALVEGMPHSVSGNDSAPTVLTAGDLDLADSKTNGLDYLAFLGANIQFVYHHNEAFPDTEMMTSLEKVISSASAGTTAPITAAFIENLNNDSFPDLLYARNGQVFVTSYKGRGWSSGLPIFENWTNPVITAPGGEKIRSISAVELTQDRYPDLIVETDRFVHFYKSNPK